MLDQKAPGPGLYSEQEGREAARKLLQRLPRLKQRSLHVSGHTLHVC